MSELTLLSHSVVGLVKSQLFCSVDVLDPHGLPGLLFVVLKTIAFACPKSLSSFSVLHDFAHCILANGASGFAVKELVPFVPLLKFLQALSEMFILWCTCGKHSQLLTRPETP